MRLRIGGDRATDHEVDGVGVGTTGLDVIRLDFAGRDRDDRGRPRHKVRIEITADDLAGEATSDPVLCAVVRHMVLMLEARGVDWRANRYLESDDPEPPAEPETCTVCEGPIDENGECRCLVSLDDANANPETRQGDLADADPTTRTT